MIARKSARHVLPPPRWTLYALLAIPWVSHAESLTDAWAMALQSDGTVAAAHSERDAADAEHTAALRQRWPSLDLNGNYTQLQHAPVFEFATPAGQLQAPIWRHDGYAAAGADLSVPIWTSGRTSEAVGAAAAGVRGAAARGYARTKADRLQPAKKMKPNYAHSVDAPIASLFHIVHPWRRATDAHR